MSDSIQSKGTRKYDCISNIYLIKECRDKSRQVKTAVKNKCANDE